MASRSNKTVRYAQSQLTPKTPPAGMGSASTMSAIRSTIAAKKPAAQLANTLKPLNRIIPNTSTPGADQTDASGNRLGGRRAVGPADEATRRQFLDNALKPGPAVKPAPAPKPAPTTDQEGGVGNRARRKVIDQTVDKMS